MKKQIRISCLPVAGIMNPYQHLMMQGLSADGRCIARNGYKDRLTGIIRTAIGMPSDYMHFDWIDGLYSRRIKLFTYINVCLFVIQIWLVKNVFRTKIVCTLHNLHPHDHDQQIHYKVHNWFYKQCTWVRVFSELTAKKAGKMYHIPNAKIKIIPIGSYKGYYPDNVSSHDAKKALGVDQYRRVYVSFGNIRPYKGLENFIHVFNRMAQPDEFLLIAGRSPYPEFLDKLCSIAGNQIRFDATFIPKEDVQLYFRAADIMVSPFLEIENSGTVLLAMDFGKAVLAPKSGLMPAYLHGQPALLYADGELENVFQYAQQISDQELLKFGDENKQQAGTYLFSHFVEAFL